MVEKKSQHFIAVHKPCYFRKVNTNSHALPNTAEQYVIYFYYFKKFFFMRYTFFMLFTE